MPIELKIPTVGESITEVQISEWLKAEGDAVNKDESVAVIDSEKTTFELPAPESGRLVKILHKAGDTVNVGAVVAQIEPGAAAPSEKKAKPAGDKPAREEKPDAGRAAENKPKAGSPQPAPAPAERASSDLGTKREAAKSPKKEPARGKESEEAGPEHPDGEAKTEQSPAKPTVTPTPKSAAETRVAPAPTGKEDPPKRKESRETRFEHFDESKAEQATAPEAEVKRPAARPSGDKEEEVVPMTMLRRTIARRLVEAQQTMAMLTTFNEVDMSAVQSLRHKHQEAFQKRYGIKLGLMSFFVKAAIEGLKQFPQLNAEARGNDIVYRNYFDIGIAIAAERGLVVPVLRRAERLSFAEIEKAIAEFALRVKGNELKPEDLEGGTFTITNGGVFGSLLSTPIINPPQSGILGLHTIADRPVAREGSVVVRPMMYAALTYDHRIVDGREAVLFLLRIKEAVEDPARMLVEV
jgi:2-oxoglutarate dehydrogenase E2 component (dihydrolipoamide succinyltransferase)